MAKTIPQDEKVFMVSKSTNTTYSGSASLKAMQEWYTMEDVTNTVRPYKVFTALLTQAGGDNPITVAGDGEIIYIEATYLISDNPDNYDLTIYGAPNNNVGTFFIANQTISLPYTNSLQLEGNYGAPYANVLENTIGNIWFTYAGAGEYRCYSEGLFIDSKSTIILGNVTYYNASGIIKSGFDEVSGIIITADYDNNSVDNYAIDRTPIEIRVYN
jgi:hypothetical protein